VDKEVTNSDYSGIGSHAASGRVALSGTGLKFELSSSFCFRIDFGIDFDFSSKCTFSLNSRYNIEFDSGI